MVWQRFYWYQLSLCNIAAVYHAPSVTRARCSVVIRVVHLFLSPVLYSFFFIRALYSTDANTFYAPP